MSTKCLCDPCHTRLTISNPCIVLSSQGKGHCVHKCLCDPCHTRLTISSPCIVLSSQGKGHCVHKVFV